MPSTITHAFIGLDTIDKLNNKPKKIINDHINNYKVYCQNMDILYFYHIYLLKSNKIQDLGHKFHHEHVFDSFNLLIEDNKINKDLELFTLIAGFITHYQADAIMHPYVNSMIYDKWEEKNIHFEIETYIDNYFVNTRLNSNHKKYNNTDFVFNYTEEEIIKKELNKLFMTYFSYPGMGEKYLDAGFEPLNINEVIGWKILKRLTNHEKLKDFEIATDEEMYDKRNIEIEKLLNEIYGTDNYNYSVWYKNDLHNVYVYSNGNSYEYEYFEEDDKKRLEKIDKKERE